MGPVCIVRPRRTRWPFLVRIRLLTATDARTQARRLAARLAPHLRAHPGLVALPGGASPGPLFDALARTDATWHAQTVTLSDERWISQRSNASNEHAVRARLLKAQARHAHFAPLKTPQPTPRAAQARVAATLDRAGAFTLCVLGMGEDGHIASLFPGDARALRARSATVAVHAPHAAGAPERLSLSLRKILTARLIVIFLRGREKLAALRRWLDPSAPETPIRTLVRARRGPIWVSWAP